MSLTKHGLLVGFSSRGHCITNVAYKVTKTFSEGTPIFATDNIDHHDMIKIVRTVSLNTYLPIHKNHYYIPV